MKKITILISVLVLSVFLFSCTKGPEGDAGITGADAGGGLVLNFQDGLYPSAGYSDTADARISSSAPDSVEGDYFSMGVFSASSHWRVLVKFDVEGYLPAGATVTGAYITFKMYSGDGVVNATAYRVSRAWIEDEVTWNSYSTGNNWTTPGADYGSAVSGVCTIDEAGTYVVNLDPSMVQAWVNDDTTNYGIIFIAANETTPLNRYHGYTSEAGTAADRPKLTIIYEPQ